MANTLIALPNEILHNILKYVDPRDLGEVFMVCKQLHKFINDLVLFKEVYCILLGEPVSDFKPVKFDYKEELLSFCQARRAVTSKLPVVQKRQDLPALSRYISTACRVAHSKDLSIQYLKEWFDDKGRIQPQRDNTEAFLCQSNTFFRARHQENTLSNLSFVDRQASAKLHVYYGVPIFLPRTRRWQTTYPYAVSMVYDLRNYTENSKWGPYLPDGQASVDWEKMEAVMLVLGHNMHAFTRQTHGSFPKVWTEPFEGITPDSYVDDGKFQKPRKEDVEARSKIWDMQTDSELVRYPIPEGLVDPYNITGTWTRVVCFLDFHDLFAYNFTTGQPAADQPRPALNTTEAIRLITMEIRATKSEKPGPNDGQDLPIIHFEGISKSSMNTSWDANANSTIRGTVRMTKEGEVRWQTISVYAGEERWASEGIQVGGIRSGRGIIGHWFDKDHDVHGPAGPTAFWKTSDGFREYDEEAATFPSANVQHEDEDEEGDDEEIFELDGVTAADLVTELQLSGQTTAAQLHDVLTQIVMGHLQGHQGHNIHHGAADENRGEREGEGGEDGGDRDDGAEEEEEEYIVHRAPSPEEEGQGELERSDL